MTGLTRREVAVHEIEIADERAIVEGGAIGGALPAADQCAERGAAELVDLVTHRPDRLGGKRSKGASDTVQDPELELLTRSRGHILKTRPPHKSRQLLDRFFE